MSVTEHSAVARVVRGGAEGSYMQPGRSQAQGRACKASRCAAAARQLVCTS
jgi:hypothetical protein